MKQLMAGGGVALIINNGKAPAMEVTEKAKEERESILEKLKAAKEPGHKPPAWFGERNLE